MKKALKDIIRELWKSKIRGLYIFIMIFLGLATYIGLNLTNYDIKDTLDNYRIEYNLYDLKIIGKLDSDLENDNDIDELESTYIDYFTEKGTANVISIASINEKISKPILMKGRYPEKVDEVILSGIDADYEIGNYIILEKKDKLQEHSIKERKLKIVGIYEDPEYVSKSVKNVVNIGTNVVKISLLSKKELFNMYEPNLHRIKLKEFTESKISDENFNNNINLAINNLKEKYKLSEDNYYSSIVDNSSLISFKDSIKTLDTIKILFPIVFYMVVILVCTTNLTRMIGDQRRIIGTYKFLGYKNRYIYLKYMLIALIPTIISIIPGILVGTYYMPKLIFKAFAADSIEIFSVLKINFSVYYVSTAVILSLICVILSVILSLRSVLKENIVELLRGKQEISGEKILFEYITPIWNRFSFKAKITLRNIFRYKKRMIMSIIGISGCVSLMFLGFGIKESFQNIVSEHIYIREINYNVKYTGNSKEIIDNMKNNEYINAYVENISITDINNNNQNIEVDILDNNKFNNIKFIDLDTNTHLSLSNDGVYITKRIAKLIDKKEGDNLKININGEDLNVKINKIIDNYVSHYIYLTKTYYNSISSKEINNNTLLITNNGDIKFDINKIYKLDNVYSVFDENTVLKSINVISNNLNSIIVVISILSITLSLVVSLNLMSINLSERKKEISTLKVLGFYDIESCMYIYKEILLINLISLFIGYLGGHFLINSIRNTMAETNLVLIETYNYKPFVYTAILMIIFVVIIGVILDIVIKRINMVEALKIDE